MKNMKRREFIKGSIAASGLAGMALRQPSAGAAESTPTANREYYELRAYRLKSGDSHAALDAYLERALIPALNRLGSKPIGVFVQQERSDPPASTEVRGPDTLFVLIPFSSLDSWASTASHLSADEQYEKAAADYMNLPKDKAAYERIDSWLMQAFAGMPKLEQPAYSLEKKPRMFEMRRYESHSELKAIKKIEMFNSGEIEVMREVGLGPIFYGQALVGIGLPQLTYMVSAENQEAHKNHWSSFGKNPTWNKLKNDPRYADSVSKIMNRFLVPTAYSQI
jgi:hypothetical protein